METTLFDLPDLEASSAPDAEDTTEPVTRPTTRPDLHLHYVGLAHFFATYEPAPPRPGRNREPAEPVACA